MLTVVGELWRHKAVLNVFQNLDVAPTSSLKEHIDSSVLLKLSFLVSWGGAALGVPL